MDHNSSLQPHSSIGHALVYLAVAAVLILVNAFFAASETSFLAVRDSRISQLVGEGNKRAAIVARLKEHPEWLLVSLQIMVTLVTALASSLATSITEDRIAPIWGKAAAVSVATIFVLFFLSLLGEITPKNWAVTHAEWFALKAAPTVNFFSSVLIYPLTWILERLSMLILRLLRVYKPSVASYPTEEEIKHIVEEGARFGELEPEEKEMIHSIMEIPGITAREIMTPRTQIIGVEIDTPIPDVAALIVEEGHTRIPVYQGSLDEIVGIINAKDLLPVLQESHSIVSLSQLMKKPLQIPESKKVDKLLKDFKSTKSQMAIVLDEYGGTAGLVTMEDVLEEIVGPIDDEYDETEESDIQAVDNNHYLVVGSAGLEDVCEALDIVVEEEDAEGNDTIGGLVFGLLGRVPEVGDLLDYTGWRMEVLSVVSRRVDRLRVSRIQEPTKRPSDDTADSPG